MNLLEHAHQQQDAEEEQQGFKLDDTDVFENRVQVRVVTHESRHQEHDGQAEQKGQNRWNSGQGIAGDRAQDC